MSKATTVGLAAVMIGMLVVCLWGAIAPGEAPSLLPNSSGAQMWGGAESPVWMCCKLTSCPWPKCRGCIPLGSGYRKYSNFITDCYCQISLAIWEHCGDDPWQLCSSTALWYSDDKCKENESPSGATCWSDGCRGGDDSKCWGNHDCD